MNANKITKNVFDPQEDTPHRYGFAHKSELDKLKENIFRSDKEKLYLFVKMLRRNQLLKKPVITPKAE